MTHASFSQEPVRIGIDVGGTKIAGVTLSPSGAADNLTVVPTAQGNEALLSSLHKLITDLLAAAGHPAAEQTPALIGIGIPGKIDATKGVVDTAVNVGIDHLNLAQELSANTAWRICIDNDVNAAALGAVSLLPEEKTHGTHVYLNLGTGLAAGIVVNGHVLRGAKGAAGEIGHLAVEPHHYPCKCGQSGCLETVASGGAVERLWPHATGPALPSLIHAADSGDSHGQEILAMIIQAIAATISALCLTCDPETVTIGGGMSKTGEPLLRLIQAELNKRAHTSDFLASLSLAQRVHLVPPHEPIGALGAALLTQDFHTQGRKHND